MSFTNDLTINIYSIVLLIFISINALIQFEKNCMQHRLYIMMVLITILMLVVDIFSRFDGNPGTIYPVINYIGNFLIYLLNPILPSIWLLYVHLQIFHDEKKTRRWLYSLLAVNAGNIVMLVLSQFFGWFYYIDPNNIYHRGWLFWLPVSITVTLTLAAFVLVALNRKNIEKKYLFALVFFPIPPFVCVILQIIFYGIPLMLNSVAFSLLIVSFYIQNRSMNTDYLTGVSNRKRLETYMREKINTSTEDKTFSAILIDLDDFKFINDTFGHDIGDYVLGTLVKLLKSCLRSGDFIARFGGDEFYIILDVSNRDALEATVYRINNCIEKYNECANKPYKLGLSMGYSVYDYNSHMKVEDFQKHIDILMYENKRASKNEL